MRKQKQSRLAGNCEDWGFNQPNTVIHLLEPNRQRSATMSNAYERVSSKLLPTYQSLAAIALHAEVSNKECEKILVEMYNNGLIKGRQCRMDGHNLVHVFKKIEKVTIFGQQFPINDDN